MTAQSKNQLPEYLLSWSGMPFDINATIWKLDNKVNLEWLACIKQPIADLVRTYLAKVAMNYSCTTLRNDNNLLREFLSNTQYEKYDEGAALSFIASRSITEKLKAKRVMLYLYKIFEDNGLFDISSETIQKIDLVRFEKKTDSNKLEAIGEDAPLTDSEVASILNLAHQNLSSGRICLSKYALIVLLIYTGRRPKQISYFKFKDVFQKADGTYWLSVPRVKSGLRIRETFRDVPIGENSIWDLLKTLHDLVINQTENRLGRSLNKKLLGELPLFPKTNWPAKNISDERLKNELNIIPNSHICVENLSAMLSRDIQILDIPSERHSGNLKVTPKNFRDYLLSRLVRKKVDFSIAAEMMDHNNARSLRRYFKNPADLFASIEDLLSDRLAPITRAFTKDPIAGESDAELGEIPLSRTYSLEGEAIGNCSSSDLGAGCRPLQCYTCRSFQPWLHGGHKGVLHNLEVEIQKHIDSGQSEEYIYAFVLTLLGVKGVINTCEERLKEEGGVNE
ncbi:MAG: site-specific integrase [Lentisphaeraceae bacterium]|nr:site-specific integrase [Lentisphaeraceae bacterium]